MFYLRHFKNFETATLDHERSVTLLVGPNGAGKSNLIEAIELLAFLANGRPLHEITDLNREGSLEIRGGLDSCPSYGEDTFTLGHRLPVNTSQGVREATYEVSVKVAPEPRIAAEVLRIEGRAIPIFEVLPLDEPSVSADNLVRYDNYSQGKNKPVVPAAAERSALSQYARFAVGNKKLSETLEIVAAVYQALEAPSVFDPVPRLMRNYERNSETTLARNGFNISPVLQSLVRNRIEIQRDAAGQLLRDAKGNPKLKKYSFRHVADRILKRISQFPDEPFTNFDFIKTKAGDVIFGFEAQNSKHPVTARILSDGTLRALAILTAVETSSAGKRLILEEFDNGIHPSRVQILAEALFDCADRNHLQIIATTQNPATLNALTDEQSASVLLVTHGREPTSARLLKLVDLPGYFEFMEQGRLGDLITRRVYEKHLMPGFDAEHTAKMEQWMQALP